MNIAPLAHWPMIQRKLLVIAGPCSAETEEQVHETATALAKTNRVSLLRAGIWKPRTRPGHFQGMGEVALPWLVDAGKANGLPTTTEVANASHVEQALNAGVDILWIGARTTVNPFSVQEIADALRGVDVPVIIKNPINPDLQLWIGAIERIAMTGNPRIMAMHRGFSGVATGTYRNAPQWEIPIALKAHFPTLPVICDPSHITGDRNHLRAVAQKALDLGMHGLMIETHPRPDEAWSDAAQQITPENLSALLDQLEIRTTQCPDPTVSNELAKLRSQIDVIDDEILRYLSKRMSIIEEIGAYKKENGLTILQLDRWKEIMRTRTELAQTLQLSEGFIVRYLELIHEASIKRQSQIMNENGHVLW